MKRILASILFVSLFCKLLNAQELGGYPSLFHWNQINTDTVRVVFPDGMEQYAQRVCNLTTELQKRHSFSIGNKHRKLDIVLRNQSVISNAYVGLAPFRSEFYTTPPSQNDDLGTLPWLDLLSIHEYRHAMQFSNSNQGISRLGYFLMGDYGLAIISNISVPNWFWEGDAVCNETALSQQGRGRLPSFYLGFKTLEQSKTRYTYMKVRNGSFKDYVPNHYELGYLMCSYARNKFDNNVWANVFAKGVGYNYFVYPFSNALKANTGLGTVALYNQSLNSYSADWQKQVDTLHLTPTTTLNTKGLENIYSNYLYPSIDEKGNVICLKKSFNRPASFVQIDNQGNEKPICLLGITLEDNFSYAKQNLAWTQYHTDIRWSGYIYSDIVLYNIDTHTKKSLTTNGKYFSPSLSPVKPEVVAAYSDKPDFNKLIILNIETGETIKEIGANKNYFYTNPIFDESGENIISSVRNAKGQAALVKINCKNNDIEILTPFSYNAIGRPVCSTQGIYFTAGFSGIDNLYILDKHNIVKQISSIETGVSAVAVDNNNQNIALSVYTKDGYRIEYLPVNKSLNKTVTITEPIDQTNYATSFAKTEGGDILTHSIPTNQRNVTSYNSFENLLKIHSWQLYSNGQNMGLMLYTENTLNTLTGLAGFVYNKNEKRPYFTGELNWSVGYPILHLAATTTLDESKPKETPLYYTNKQDYQMGLQLPLNLTRGNYYRSITAEFGLLRTQINELANNIAYNSHSQGYYCDFVLSNQKQAAYQNLGSPLGQNIHLNYKKSFEGVMAQRFRADGFFSVRGIFPNQNLKLQAHYGKQKFESQPLIYTDDFFYTPGYKSYSLYDNIKRAEVSYHLPLCYPDFGFAGLIYLRRIQLAGYYNYSTSESHRFHELEMNSTGGEILFDTKLLNIQSVTWGLRYNYRLSKVDEMFKGNDIDFYFAIGTF